MSQWKVISQKSVFKAPLFSVDEIDYINEAHIEKKNFVAERVPTVTIFPISRNLEIYLVSQFRPMLNKKTLEAIAGYIEKNETALEAAKRELKEEGGIVASHWEEMAKVEMAASVFKGRLHLFLARDIELGEPQPTETEDDIQLVKLRLGDAVNKVMHGEINHTDSMIGILMLENLRVQKKLKP